MPCKTIPKESPTKIISQYLSAICAIVFEYAVRQVIGILFFLLKIFFVYLFLISGGTAKESDYLKKGIELFQKKEFDKSKILCREKKYYRML